MKKYLLIYVVALSACTNYVKPESANLTKLTSEPKNCALLYTMDADANFYSEDDAIRYVENQIVKKGGNSFFITKKEKHQNEWKMFAPEYSYTITANVYDCPAIK
jgi:hypothetical protein